MTNTNPAASVRQRLLNLAQAQGWEFNRMLARYGVERTLFRLAASPQGNRFVLKGATLFTVWQGAPHRATKDLDLLGLRRRSFAELVELFQQILSRPVEPDGLVFKEVTGEAIRTTMEEGGVRLMLRAELASARLTVQVDVGFGDAIVPPPVVVEFPTLLGSARPKLLAYPPETVISEKLEAMTRLGLVNSRMKDFFDVWHLARSGEFESLVLASAIRATFNSRNTGLPSGTISALTPEFACDPGKRTQWAAFIRQGAFAETPPELPEVVEFLNRFLGPLLQSLHESAPPARHWSPARGWSA